MAIRRTIPLALGFVALLVTVAIIAIFAVLSIHLPPPSGKAASQVALAVEVIVFGCVGWLFATYSFTPVRYWSMKSLGVDQGFSLLASICATVAGVATLVQLSKSNVSPKDNVVGSSKDGYVTGTAVTLGFSFLFQTLFLFTHFLYLRSSEMAQSLHSYEEDRKSPVSKVKTVRYSQTTPTPEPVTRLSSLKSQAPSSVGGRSRAGTMSSMRSTISQAIRPISSKTQLLSKDTRRPASIDCARRRSGEDTFESWDTSTVDDQNRQVVMELSTPPQIQGRFLETIPGSPTATRTPSPNTTAMGLEKPRARPRSRSYSPAPRGRVRTSPALQSPPSMAELHIHPLFRSDSPDPPPVTTPGTIVTASPNAGQVISHRQSVRSLNQTRVSSNPIFSSPLCNQDEQDDNGIQEEDEVEEEEEEEEEENDVHVDPTSSPSERVVTPPIPEWVLGAGTRSSWADYNDRRVRSDSEERQEEETQKH